MHTISPCKGCTNRHTACHGSCEAYKGWLDQYHAQQKHLEANKNRWEVPFTAAREKAIRDHVKSGAPIRKTGGYQ